MSQSPVTEGSGGDHRLWRWRGLSLLTERRAPLFWGLLIALSLLLAFVTLGLGSYPIHPLAALGGQDSPMANLLMWNVRLPRLALACGAGAALGLSGALTQRVLGNPLATPDILGIAGGAATGAIAMRSLLPALTGNPDFDWIAWQPLGAAAGAVLAAALALGLSADREGHVRPLRCVLNGLALSLFFGAAADLMMSRLPELEAGDATRWLSGSLAGAAPEQALHLWLGLLPGLVLAAALGFRLSRLDGGDDLAAGLGLAPGRLRLQVLVLAVALTALAVGTAGPLPFVALAAAPVTRGLARLLGLSRSPGPLAEASAGAVLVMLADLVARLLPAISLPTGIFTALFGAPVLIIALIGIIRKGDIG